MKTTAKKEKKTQSLRGGLKVRHFIMDLLYRHPAEAIQIPSSSALATKFGIARSTVMRVIADLIRRGYLESRNGIGTFSCHRGFTFPDEKPTPMIGMIFGDGKLYFHDAFNWGLPAYTGIELTRKNYSLRYLPLTGNTEAEVVDEIQQFHLDGLVWFYGAESSAAKLQAEGLPVILVGNEHAAPGEFNTISFDFNQAGREYGERMLAEKRHNLYFMFLNANTEGRLRGIKEVYENAHEPLTVRTFDYQANLTFPLLEKEFAAGKIPDSIFIYAEHGTTLFHLLEKYQIDTKTRCRILTEEHRVDLRHFHGYAMHLDYEKLAREITERMTDLLVHPEIRKTSRFDCPVRSYQL